MTFQELMDACEQVRESRGFDGSSAERSNKVAEEADELMDAVWRLRVKDPDASIDNIAQEFGDVMFTILTHGAALQREFGIDPLKATLEKLEDTKRRYPEVEK